MPPMPQMAPMMWLIYQILFLMTIIPFISTIHFFPQKNNITSKPSYNPLPHWMW